MFAYSTLNTEIRYIGLVNQISEIVLKTLVINLVYSVLSTLTKFWTVVISMNLNEVTKYGLIMNFNCAQAFAIFMLWRHLDFCAQVGFYENNVYHSY